jgi:hypothetical protein
MFDAGDSTHSGAFLPMFAPLGILVAAFPWVEPLLLVLTTGPAHMREPSEVVVYRDGYQVSGARISAWNPWAAFTSARVTGNDLVLNMRESNAHGHISIAPLSATERAKLLEIMAAAGVPAERG